MADQEIDSTCGSCGYEDPWLDAQIDELKADRQALLKLRKAIEDHRKRPAGTVRPITIADETLYSIAKKVRGEGP